MDYPPELEAWWLAAARKATGLGEDACLSALEPVVAQLSDLFTTDRPDLFGNYASAEPQRLAYGLFYFPQTYVRVTRVVRAWPAAAALPHARPLRILDLGSGSGASILAAAHALQPTPLSLTALDHAPESLDCLQRLFTDLAPLWPNATLSTRTGQAQQDGIVGTFDLIIASFVLNEIFPAPHADACHAWISAQLARLSPDGALMILEPAGGSTSPRLQRLRDAIARGGDARILAPCLHARPCPLTGSNCGWCHDVLRWRVPDTINRLNRRLFRSVHDLKYSVLVLAPADLNPPSRPWDGKPDWFRMIGPMSRAKGRLVTRGCCADGVLRGVELMTRAMTRQQENELTDWDRGDIVSAAGMRLLDGGRVLRAESLRRTG